MSTFIVQHQYASFIDEAVMWAIQEVGERRSSVADEAVEKLKEVDGKHMVERASVEFMSFVEDTYMFLRKDR